MEYYATLSAMKHAAQKETYNRSMSKRKYVVQFEEADKKGDCRGFVGGLFECLLWIRMFPILVVTVDWEIEIETAEWIKARHTKATINLLFVLYSTWPTQRRAHLAIVQDKYPTRP